MRRDRARLLRGLSRDHREKFAGRRSRCMETSRKKSEACVYHAAIARYVPLATFVLAIVRFRFFASSLLSNRRGGYDVVFLRRRSRRGQLCVFHREKSNGRSSAARARKRNESALLMIARL